MLYIPKSWLSHLNVTLNPLCQCPTTFLPDTSSSSPVLHSGLVGLPSELFFESLCNGHLWPELPKSFPHCFPYLWSCPPSALQLERHLRDKFTCHCLCLSLATHPTVIFQLVITTDCTHCGPTHPPFWSAPRVCPPPCPLCLLQFPVNHYRHSLAHTFFLSFFCFI